MATPPVADLLVPRRFSVEDYYAMAKAGILDSDERVELLDGQVIRMSAIGILHRPKSGGTVSPSLAPDIQIHLDQIFG